jgi:hypothetical protein
MNEKEMDEALRFIINLLGLVIVVGLIALVIATIIHEAG